MPPVVIDDHLLRDILTSERERSLGGIAPDGIATTGLWLYRLCLSLAEPAVAGKLSAPVASLPEETQVLFRSRLTALPRDISVVPVRELSWTMALLQKRHRGSGRHMSAAMVEALAAAHTLGGTIAVSRHDVGPHLQAAAAADDVAFHIL